MEQFDVVVVGARCAGAPLATVLARRGLRVCVLDRARFPSDTASTHVIQPRGVAVLERLGVLSSVLGAGAVPVERFTLVNDDVRIAASLRAPGLCIRRVTLDAVLVRAAVDAGADVRTGVGVDGLLVEDGRVVGVRTSGGPIGAALVVGADGRNSTVAALVEAREYHVAPAGRLFAWGYFAGVSDPEPRLRIGRRGPLAFIACPTDGGQFMAGVAPPMSTKATFLADRDRAFADGLASWPELADLLAGSTRVGPLRTVPDWHGYFRCAAGPGWVLTGDAGHFKDPTPAQGISDAFRQAWRLADAVVAGLGGADLDAALREWWRWRDEDCYEMYWFAVDMGAGGPSSPLVTEMLRTIAEDDDGPAQLLQVLNRERRPAQLFTARRIARAVARAARRYPGRRLSLATEVATAAGAEVRRARRRRRHRTGAAHNERTRSGLT